MNSITGNKLFRTELVQEFDILFPQLQTGETLSFYHQYLSICETISMIQDPILVAKINVQICKIVAKLILIGIRINI